MSKESLWSHSVRESCLPEFLTSTDLIFFFCTIFLFPLGSLSLSFETNLDLQSVYNSCVLPLLALRALNFEKRKKWQKAARVVEFMYEYFHQNLAHFFTIPMAAELTSDFQILRQLSDSLWTESLAKDFSRSLDFERSKLSPSAE